MKNSDCVYPTLLRLKVVVPGSTMAPFPPVTGPVTVGFAAEGRGRWALPACADAAATASKDAMVTAAATRASQRGVLVMPGKVTPLLMAVKHHFHKSRTGFSLTVSTAPVSSRRPR